MAVSAISGFNPALALIGTLSPVRQASLLPSISSVSSLSGLFSITSTQASISSLGRLLNDVETLQTAATALAAPGVFVARTVSVSSASTSSAPAIATASASAATPTGSYTLQVDQLAQAQTLTTAAQASARSLIGSGQPTTISFQFGGGSTRSVTLGAADNTLAGIAAAVNAAGIGIEARLLTSSSGVRLALSGPSGAGNAFSIAVSGDAALAGALAFPPGGSGGPTLSTAARDAQGAVNGIAFSGSTNNVHTGITGLSLNLLGTGPATLTVAANRDAAKAVENFVGAFNDVQRGFAELAAANPAQALTVSVFSSRLSATLTAAGSGSPLSTLAQVGITNNVDGTLSFNPAGFQAALNANQEGVAALFRNGGSGLAERVAAIAAGPLSPAEVLPVLTPALSFQGMLGVSTQDSLLLSLFDQGGTLEGSSLASSFSSQLLFADLLATSRLDSQTSSRTGSAQTSTALADLLLSELLFANQF